MHYILDGQPKPEDSELQKLLKKNALGAGLTTGEKAKAHDLISNSEFSEALCENCKKEKAIFDTGLCKGCALYALITRK